MHSLQYSGDHCLVLSPRTRAYDPENDTIIDQRHAYHDAERSAQCSKQEIKQSSQLFNDAMIVKLEIFTEILRHITNTIKNETQHSPPRKV